MTSTELIRILGSMESLLAATIYQGNRDLNHKLWNFGSTEGYIIYNPYAGTAGMLLYINGSQWEN